MKRLTNPLAASRRLRRGSALLAAMSCAFLLMVLGVGLISTMLSALHQSRKLRDDTLAFNLAESGAERGVRWLKDQAYPPATLSPFDPFGGDQTFGDGTYSVIIEPAVDNSGATLKRYKVVVDSEIYGKTARVELIVRQQSFGRYAYFTDRETSAISGGRIWFFSGDRIRGPAHSNNVGGSNFQINWLNGSQPIFEGMVTSAGPSMNYSPSNPNTEPQFLSIYRDGSRGYQLDVDPIPLPSSSDLQKEAAWGSSSGFPGTNGVYTPAGGGVYIRGDSAITMSVGANSSQIYTIVQGATTTTVTIDYANNQRRMQVGTNPPVITAGAGTGVLYSTGHITSLSGTIANNRTNADGTEIVSRSAHTIATDVNNGRNVTVTSNIQYQNPPDPALAVSHPTNLRPGTLGLIARNVTIAATAPTNLRIDAVCLAGSSSTSDGSFSVANYNTKVPTGTLTLMGGIIQKARGAVGTLSGGVLATGYAKNYYYDPRLADSPPPYFPTTGLFDRVSWRRLGQEDVQG
jgi:hypothetical protein